MKKKFFDYYKLTLAVLCLGLLCVSCGEDSDSDPFAEYPQKMSGKWYCAEHQEIDSYLESGSLQAISYDEYGQELMCSNGQYSIKEDLLTCIYHIGDEYLMSDFQVKSLSNNEMKLYNKETGWTLTYGRVIREYVMDEGETMVLNIDNYTIGESSVPQVAEVKNGRIVAHDLEGVSFVSLQAESGETAYMMITVGDGHADNIGLWGDEYAESLGLTYEELVARFGTPHESDYSKKTYMYSISSRNINYASFQLSKSTDKVIIVGLTLSANLEVAKVTEFLKSKYTYNASLSDNEQRTYMSGSTEGQSKFFVYHYIHTNTVFYVDNVNVESEELIDITDDFGKTKQQMKSKYLDWTLDAEETSYLVYKTDDKMVGLVQMFFENNKFYRYISSLYSNVTESKVKSILSKDYFYDGDYVLNDEENTPCVVFYNSNKSIEVIYVPSLGLIQYTLVSNPDEPEQTGQLWQDYTKDLGLSRTQIKTKYGTPVAEEDDYLGYFVDNDYVQLSLFGLNDSDKVQYVMLQMNSEIEKKVITDYLNSLYPVFESGTTSDGKQYAWLTEDKKTGIVFDAEQYYLQYIDLTSESNIRMKRPELMQMFSKKFKSRSTSKQQTYKFIKK